MNDLSNCNELIGRKVIVIDETQSKNNISIHTISEINEEGWHFGNLYGPTVFALDKDEALFIKGHKAYIHPEEVSIQLI
jgi:hypothetical protein